MFNLGAGEVLVIMLLALLVLGPQRLPEAARQIGKFTGEIRRLSSGFQQEMKSAFEAETEAAARARGAEVAEPEVEDPEVDEPEVEATEVEATEVEATEVEATEVEAADAPEPVADDDTSA